MKKLLKVIGVMLVLIVLVIVGGLTYVTQALPNIPVPADLHVEMTPERVARGEYLANHVTICMDCHSTRDWNKFSGPVEPGTLGKGGEVFDQNMGFPGRFVSKNITPFNLRDWSDGDIYRAITSGVSKDGHPFFPVMPYLYYNKLATEDVYSIIAYLRTLPPIESHPDDSEAEFPMSVILHTIPEEPHPLTLPEPTDADYGAYMVNAAGCRECHTKMEKGKAVGEPFAGGFEFNFPNGSTVRSANITPDMNTGIGAWDRETFIRKFKQFGDSSYVPLPVDWSAQDFQTVMPWVMYGGMSEQDLGAIYDYLHALDPVVNKVEYWSPAHEKRTAEVR
ncbi:MAG: c-type cytochrome [Flavobacteriales bacterium]|nr:c-type cytochrome [Flavobacteriales bacterium]